MKRSWSAALFASLLVVASFGIGYAVGDDGHGAGDDHGLGGDRMARMMADGAMPEMMADFVEQMEQMRESMTPEMREQMDRDPMWQLMASGELQEMMERHGRSMQGMPGMEGGRGHRDVAP